MYICIILDNEYKYNRTRCDTVVMSSRYYIWLLEQTWARTDWQFLASLSLPSQSSPSSSSWPKVSKALRRWAFCHPWKLWKTNQWSCHPVQIVLLRRIGQVGRFRTLAVAKRIQETKKKQAKEVREVREAEVHSTLRIRNGQGFADFLESDWIWGQVPAMLASPHRGRLPSAHPAAICACQVERIKNHPHNRISIHLSPFWRDVPRCSQKHPSVFKKKMVFQLISIRTGSSAPVEFVFQGLAPACCVLSVRSFKNR